MQKWYTLKDNLAVIELSILLWSGNVKLKHIHTKFYTWMFIAALLIISKHWKPIMSSSKWMSKCIEIIQTMKHYSVVKESQLTGNENTLKYEWKYNENGRTLNVYY